MGYVPNQQTTILNSVPNITASLLLFCRYGSLWCIYRHPILAIKLNSVYIWWSTMTCSLVHWFWYCEHRQPPSLVIMWHRAGLRDQTRRCAPSHLSVFDPHDTGSHRIKCQEWSRNTHTLIVLGWNRPLCYMWNNLCTRQRQMQHEMRINETQKRHLLLRPA